MLRPDQRAQCGEDLLALSGRAVDSKLLLGQQQVGATAQGIRMIVPEHSFPTDEDLFLQVPGLGQVALAGQYGRQDHSRGKRVRVIVAEPVLQPADGGLRLGPRADEILLDAQGGGDVQPADKRVRMRVPPPLLIDQEYILRRRLGLLVALYGQQVQCLAQAGGQGVRAVPAETPGEADPGPFDMVDGLVRTADAAQETPSNSRAFSVVRSLSPRVSRHWPQTASIRLTASP